MLYKNIKQLVQYGIDKGITEECERVYSTNLLLELFGEIDYKEEEIEMGIQLEDILNSLLDEACSRGIIEDNIVSRDLFDTKMMNCLLPRPHEVQRVFWEKYNTSSKEATSFYYQFSQNSDYIRRYRTEKDIKWLTDTNYGTLEITINLAKPEKDPKAIAAAKNVKQTGYPKCLLCMENEGYGGHLGHPARNSHRIIPISIRDEEWALQYSPYVYYKEHCIVLSKEHRPMVINRATFEKLFDFIKLFPHYFIGSNADLPIVGGSILSHEHFQGGNYALPITNASIKKTFKVKGYENVTAGILDWPLSVIRLQCKDEIKLIDLAEHILNTWKTYTDKESFIFSSTNGESHNTITPIGRKNGEMYELDLALRNNITTEEHPLGVYHPHSEYHHIKKENIGLIEVMGLAVLPSRLKEELDLVGKYLVDDLDLRMNEKIEKHADWTDHLLNKYGTFNQNNIEEILRKEVGLIFCKVLENAGVYKNTMEDTEAFLRFVEKLNK